MVALEVSRGMVEVAMRVVVLIRVIDTCSLKTLEVVILLMVLLLGMVLAMVMEATVQVMGVLEEGMAIHLVRRMGILVALELVLEVVRDLHGKVKHHRVMVTTWDMEMLLLLLGVVLVQVQQ